MIVLPSSAIFVCGASSETVPVKTPCGRLAVRVHRPRLAVEAGGHRVAQLIRARDDGGDVPLELLRLARLERAERPGVHVGRVLDAVRRPRLRVLDVPEVLELAVHDELRPPLVGQLGVVLAVVEPLHRHGDVRDLLRVGVADDDHELRALGELLLGGERGLDDLDLVVALGLVLVLALAAAAAGEGGDRRRRDKEREPPPQSGRNIPPAVAPPRGFPLVEPRFDGVPFRRCHGEE